MKEKMIIFEVKHTNSISLHKFIQMIALTGIYHNGRLTFLEETKQKSHCDDLYSRFSFEEARELLKDYKGSFSDAVIEERRES